MADGRMRDRDEGLWARLKRFALTDVGALMRGLNAEDLEKMERVLIEADFGVPATVELTQALEDEVRKGKLRTEEDLRLALEGRLAALLDGMEHPGVLARADSGPTVILLIGVNGTGKTTTAAKLARRLGGGRSEEHTSELQSQSNLVCRLLLEKKKKKKQAKQKKNKKVKINKARKN